MLDWEFHDPVLRGLARDLLPSQVKKMIETAKDERVRVRYERILQFQKQMGKEMED